MIRRLRQLDVGGSCGSISSSTNSSSSSNRSDRSDRSDSGEKMMMKKEKKKKKKKFVPIVVVLEGGYNIPAVSMGLHACIAELLGVCALADNDEEDGGEGGGVVSTRAVADVQAAVRAQAPFWPCLLLSPSKGE